MTPISARLTRNQPVFFGGVTNGKLSWGHYSTLPAIGDSTSMAFEDQRNGSKDPDRPASLLEIPPIGSAAGPLGRWAAGPLPGSGHTYRRSRFEWMAGGLDLGPDGLLRCAQRPVDRRDTSHLRGHGEGVVAGGHRGSWVHPAGGKRLKEAWCIGVWRPKCGRFQAIRRNLREGPSRSHVRCRGEPEGSPQPVDFPGW